MGKLSKKRSSKENIIKKSEQISLSVLIQQVNIDNTHPETKCSDCSCSEMQTLIDQRARDYAMGIRNELEASNKSLYSFYESLHKDIGFINDELVIVNNLSSAYRESSEKTWDKIYIQNKEIEDLKSRKPEEKHFITNNTNIIEKIPKSYIIAMGIIMVMNIILWMVK